MPMRSENGLLTSAGPRYAHPFQLQAGVLLLKSPSTAFARWVHDGVGQIGDRQSQFTFLLVALSFAITKGGEFIGRTEKPECVHSQKLDDI